MQQKIMIRHFGTILQAEEILEYKKKLVKALCSLGGSILITPYVIYNFWTMKKNPEVKSIRIGYSLMLQFLFTVLNVQWSRAFRKYDVELQKKYLDGLPEYYISNFASEYLPWLLS